VPVVVYDDWNRAGSARAWWVLTHAGIRNVRILDGGLRRGPGRPEAGSVAPEPGDVTVRHDDLYAGALRLCRPSRTTVATCSTRRAPERFRGDIEPIDPVAGHIPAPATRLAPACWPTTAASLRTPTSRRLFDGVDDAALLRSGVTASVVVAALAASASTRAVSRARGPNVFRLNASRRNRLGRLRDAARRRPAQQTRKIANEIVVTNTETGTPARATAGCRRPRRSRRRPPTRRSSDGETNTRRPRGGVINSDITSRRRRSAHPAPRTTRPCGEHDAQRANRHAARRGHLRVDGGETAAAVTDGQHVTTTDGDHGQQRQPE
jgi:hypothetical protein